ncbi:RNA polymerase sigma factor FliA [Salinisphaera sp. T31B1]|uniref:RNA polymerase sigma factor FliA n=1 Tax=Salinisphaera sp. T31B1 TaxID=727963 RepID=UPI003341F3D4
MYTAQGTIDRSQVIEQYLPMVRRQALALRVRLPSSVDLDDLIQAGIVGLLDALDRFDAGQGALFSTYASQRVRGAMIDELRSRDWLPRSVRRASRELNRAIQRLQHRLGRAPSEREIAGELDIPLDEYHRLLYDVNNGFIEAYEENGTDETSATVVSDEVTMTAGPVEALLAFGEREALAAAIEELPEREKLLLALYYQEDLNLKEVGAVLGVGESRVCQLHSQAVSRLRATLAATA